MNLNVLKAVREPGRNIPFEAVQVIPPMEIRGDAVTFDDAVIKGTMMAGSDGNVTLEGMLTTTAHTCCAKCLGAADAAVQTEFREVFYRDGDPNDPEIFVYQGSEIDLELLASTTALLELPIKILCRPDCPGIAGYAVGTDEDQTDQNASQRHPFAALQQMLTKDEEV